MRGFSASAPGFSFSPHVNGNKNTCGGVYVSASDIILRANAPGNSLIHKHLACVF